MSIFFFVINASSVLVDVPWLMRLHYLFFSELLVRNLHPPFSLRHLRCKPDVVQVIVDDFVQQCLPIAVALAQ